MEVLAAIGRGAPALLPATCSGSVLGLLGGLTSSTVGEWMDNKDCSSGMAKPLIRRRALSTLRLVAALLAVGIVGFRLCEPSVAWFDAAYCISGTLTTTGLGDVVPLSRAGKAFFSAYALVGVTLTTRIIGQLAVLPLELARQKVQREVVERCTLCELRTYDVQRTTSLELPCENLVTCV